MAKEGYPFVLPIVVAGLVAIYFNSWLAGPILGVGAAVAWFFRMPHRSMPEGAVVISPADGRVVEVSRFESGDGAYVRVGIFMALWNVHVNFAPVSGTVTDCRHVDGRLLPAFRPKVSELNEHVDLVLDWRGRPVRVRQIAGLIARRIVNDCSRGLQLARGDRIGLIRFGSRVDVELPEDRVEITVCVGDRVKALSSVIGKEKA